MTLPIPSRRRLLARVAGLATVGTATSAGCLGGDDGGDRPGGAAETTTDDVETLTEATTEGSPTAAGTDQQGTDEPRKTFTTTTTTRSGGLDLREANVTAVEFEGSGGDYRFSVTLLHDDDGEDGYANWWQVEALDGTRLGRRDLLHAHGTREFTRSATIEVPDEVPCVVVRGHDQAHGYGGQAVLVTLEIGATRAVRQGPEPQSFAGADCP